MVYESGFTTRRTYSSRPIVSSYTVSYPEVERLSRVYKTTFPIYSAISIPFVTHKRIVTTPVRVVTSPTRIVTRVVRSPSPVRIVRTTRVIRSSSPEPISYSYTPSSYYVPPIMSSSYLAPSVYSPISRMYSRSLSPVRITTSPIRSTSYLKRIPPGYGERALTNYLNTEPYTTFSEEANRIRSRAESLARELHTPVVRRARSITPFPVSGYSYEPTSELAFDAYLARITNPIRHVARDIHNMSFYPEPAHKYVGKSHLASVRIHGDRAYNIRKPLYNSDKVQTDINLKSWYLRHPKEIVGRKTTASVDNKVADKVADKVVDKVADKVAEKVVDKMADNEVQHNVDPVVAN